ncbi:unnamed protein product [Prorocentrum cordatum]|uniref:Uncharacterized protein n=1 Tax=Prorocentrum cordatum TaxID=2364126 RepID=A0ABN9SJS9_9DINO|nr:unnamed protein product [Polarella glacialis]
MRGRTVATPPHPTCSKRAATQRALGARTRTKQTPSFASVCNGKAWPEKPSPCAAPGLGHASGAGKMTTATSSQPQANASTTGTRRTCKDVGGQRLVGTANYQATETPQGPASSRRRGHPR